jgi:hypothetical protein
MLARKIAVFIRLPPFIIELVGGAPNREISCDLMKRRCPEEKLKAMLRVGDHRAR